ncbi:TPA: hypothetical protein DCF80_00535 [Candidatus Saccharibacteria bacterium]|nr:hypothetical protein [Candidatus Saccharibacteria bacterium]HRK40606.1 hypothetical protein [Candidatus Saccharibacteria bacterium]
MDTTNNQSVTDDQELAKVLETMNQEAEGGVPPVPTSDSATPASDPVTNGDGLSFEETPPAGAPVATVDAPAVEEPVVAPPVEEPVVTTPVIEPLAPTTPVTPAASPELDAIKKTALEELRPLVDKLDLPADEKFDTLLLLIRSTDDKSLVAAAHDAAKAIEDETKRAQALLDVIKEIDYFSGHGQQPV